jgi:hypothetical protein
MTMRPTLEPIVSAPAARATGKRPAGWRFPALAIAAVFVAGGLALASIWMDGGLFLVLIVIAGLCAAAYLFWSLLNDPA